eukprot:TRINITY_DN101348_c0_g1_i1.p1 TRINITY_DN101348_c0_g1~~TRINITY_DN101348_c0_g1_i1.p1  ORF type:complete len:104 (+),score=12.45 TRINITY_DN101348_c0_g1_i1:255-566(+)
MEMSECDPAAGHRIVNAAGRLECHAPLPPNAEGLPAGSFEESCHGCKMSGAVLTCVCFDESRQTKETSLETTNCAWIGNQKGTLACEKRQSETTTEMPGKEEL